MTRLDKARTAHRRLETALEALAEDAMRQARNYQNGEFSDFHFAKLFALWHARIEAAVQPLRGVPETTCVECGDWIDMEDWGEFRNCWDCRVYNGNNP